MKKINPNEIKSLSDLQKYRQELEFEAYKAEVKMDTSFRELTAAFSLRNIIATVADELLPARNIFASAVDFGRRLIKGKKKKNRKSDQEETPEE